MVENETLNTIVIFGASGDLTWRKLIPSLFNNFKKGHLPRCPNIVGFSRTRYTDDAFCQHLLQGMHQFSPDTFDPDVWKKFTETLHYFPGDLTDEQSFVDLKANLEELEKEPANRLYYLAISPQFYAIAVQQLGKVGMVDQSHAKRRVIVEKPFGYDLDSAMELNKTIHSVFEESQVYRIDHYLGKETAQNILFFRFANTIFEPVWNRHYIDNIQITVAETVDVEHRGGYYDKSGILRDMFQNHLLQLVALIAMEPPATFNADAVRDERAKLLSSIRPVNLADTVRAQYQGYREADGIDPDSETATYAAMRLFVDNWRWSGVPFYLRSGKAVNRKASEIVIVFQRPPHLLFYMPEEMTPIPNILSICIQPNEGMHISFKVKEPGTDQQLQTVEMVFHYCDWFEGPLPDAYERLLIEALQGDSTLFTRSDNIEVAWRLIDPIIQGWHSGSGPELSKYKPGSWGPDDAHALLARDSRSWVDGCESHARILLKP